jgi:hypothetical protein
MSQKRLSKLALNQQNKILMITILLYFHSTQARKNIFHEINAMLYKLYMSSVYSSPKLH